MSNKKDPNTSILDLLLTDEEQLDIISKKINPKFTEELDASIAAGETVGQLLARINSSKFTEYFLALNVADVLTSPAETSDEDEEIVPSKPRAKRVAKTPLDDATVAAVRTYVKKNAGQGVVAICASFSQFPKDEIQRALKKLRADGVVATFGEKRSTTYSIVPAPPASSAC